MHESPNSAVETFEIIEDRLRDETVPDEARENVQQHYDSLTRLANTLRELGMDQAKIDRHVIEIFAGYEKELLASIKRIKATGAD